MHKISNAEKCKKQQKSTSKYHDQRATLEVGETIDTSIIISQSQSSEENK